MKFRKQYRLGRQAGIWPYTVTDKRLYNAAAAPSQFALYASVRYGIVVSRFYISIVYIVLLFI